MVAKLEDKVQETDERINKIELKEALKVEKLDTMKRDVSEMKNVSITKSQVDACGGDVISNSPIMHVMNEDNNVKSID